MALPEINPTETASWKKLQAHATAMRETALRDLFRDANRFGRFHRSTPDLLLDFSKNLITDETLEYLLSLAVECRLQEAIEALFSGDAINKTEARPALHTALRASEAPPLWIGGRDIRGDIRSVLAAMERFSHRLITGEKKGYSGKPLRDVVHIGIGGSHLGPRMLTEALKHYKTRLQLHFVSNVDGTQIAETLKGLDPQTTFFIVASKSFSTRETLLNARTARDWFVQHTGGESALEQHFAALCANPAAASAFGIPPEHTFAFWDWVGGRYSIWGAIGLPVCLAIGFDHFRAFLAGGREMDLHFTETPFQANLPVLMALLGIWYNNFFGAQTEAILPYDQHLQYLPAYLQQSGMESNGKSTDRLGARIPYPSSPILWGGVGTDGQHAFYQLLHQGTQRVPCDFIAAANSLNPIGDHHTELLANFFSQTRALAFGKSRTEVEAELERTGHTHDAIQALAPFQSLPGNQPTNSLLFKELSPRMLGQLLALYEHKVFVQGVIWNIYSFDQWGVNLGKQMAKDLLPELHSTQKCEAWDSSTNGLIAQYKAWRTPYPKAEKT